MDTPSNRAYAENASVHLAACQADSAGVIKQAETWLTAGTGAQHEPGLLGWQVQHVSALIDLHRLDDASVTLEGLEQLANHRQRRSQQAGLARVRGELESAGRRTRAARQAFDTALSLGGSSSALERAIANASYGRFLRRRGERRAAARLLQTASEGFHRLGAQPFLDRCTVETAACGLTPNRRSDGYSATLTPQEQTVARLVCTGLTNQQVADELVLSVKTIDYHLAHVYTKLDVHSRTQLMANIVRTSTSGRSRGQSPETPASSGEKPGEIPEVASHPLA
jgi:DNA-binding NarL/FixJ family response regulator